MSSNYNNSLKDRDLEMFLSFWGEGVVVGGHDGGGHGKEGEEESFHSYDFE